MSCCRMKGDGLILGISTIGIGVAIATLLNFAFQLAMGNYLQEHEFSTLIAFLGLISIFSLPLGVFESETAVTISNKHSRLPIDFGKNVSFFTPKRKHLFRLYIIALIICVISIPVSGSVERLTTGILFGLIILILVMFRVRLGMFQGKKEYPVFAISNVVNSSVKLGVGIGILVFTDIGYFSGIIAIMLGLMAGVFFLNGKKSRIHGGQKNKDYLSSNKGPDLNIIISLVFLGLMLNWDVIVANHVLQQNEAGQYSFSAVLAKLVVIASSAIIGVMIPSISEMESPLEEFGILKKLLLGYVFFALPVLAFATFFDVRIIEIIFFRSESETINGLLPIIVFCYIVTSVSQILVFYAIARHEIKERIGILSLTSIVPIFSVFFIDSLQALYSVMVGYSMMSCILLLSKELIALKKLKRENLRPKI